MNSIRFVLNFYFEIKNLHISFFLSSILMSCYLDEIASHPNVTLYNKLLEMFWVYGITKKIERSLWTSLEKHSNKLE